MCLHPLNFFKQFKHIYETCYKHHAISLHFLCAFQISTVNNITMNLFVFYSALCGEWRDDASISVASINILRYYVKSEADLKSVNYTTVRKRFKTQNTEKTNNLAI
jgi:hypothetical protein